MSDENRTAKSVVLISVIVGLSVACSVLVRVVPPVIARRMRGRPPPVWDMPAPSEATVVPPVARARDPEPDPGLVARGRERVGALDAWRPTEAACPEPLAPLPEQVGRVRAPLGDVDEPRMPEFPYPIVLVRSEAWLYARLAGEVERPTLYVWEQLLTEPRTSGRRRFEPGAATGLAFLRVPGRAGFACAGAFTATNSAMVRAGTSRLDSQAAFDELFVLFDLQLQARRAAADGLRAVEPPAPAPAATATATRRGRGGRG